MWSTTCLNQHVQTSIFMPRTVTSQKSCPLTHLTTASNFVPVSKFVPRNSGKSCPHCVNSAIHAVVKSLNLCAPYHEIYAVTLSLEFVLIKCWRWLPRNACSTFPSAAASCCSSSPEVDFSLKNSFKQNWMKFLPLPFCLVAWGKWKDI